MNVILALSLICLSSTSLAARNWSDVNKLMVAAQSSKLFSGATVYVGDTANTKYQFSTGDSNSGKIYDIASLTKVVAATTSIMILEEHGLLALTDKVSKYFPHFNAAGKEVVTLEDLLRHRAGLPAGAQPLEGEEFEAYLKRISSLPLSYKPRSKTVYSDLSFILLGRVVEMVSGVSLNDFAVREIFEPLKMTNTSYHVSPENRDRCAPTSVARNCEVHDPTAFKLLPATVGNAGVFTNMEDLSRFVRMILRKGELDGVRILSEKTVTKMTTAAGPRGLGWDVTSEYSVKPRGDVFPEGISFGHTGYTGTTIWIDPKSKSFYIFLSNRVYMGDSRTMAPFGEFRKKLSTAIGKMTVLKR